MGRIREEKRRRKKIREEKESEDVRRKRLQVRKGTKSRSTEFFLWGSGGSKSLAKAAGAEPPGEMRDDKLHAAVAQSRFRS